jgi:hypothetical protein
MNYLLLGSKILVDLMFAVCLVMSYTSDIFIYMKCVKVSLTNVEIGEIHLYLFNFNPEKYVKTMTKKWVTLGIIFIIVTSISLLLAVLSVFSILSKIFKFKVKALESKVYHFMYPFLYSVCLIAYIGLSKIYQLDDYGLGKAYEPIPQSGLIYMYSCEVLSLLSLNFSTYIVVNFQSDLKISLIQFQDDI